jgi:hypothetical protein
MRLDVLEQNRHLLYQGIELLRSLDDSRYAAGGGPEGKRASAGAHLRHVIDFYQALLRGFPARRIDYDARARDPQVETDRTAAVAALTRILAEIDILAEESADLPLQVKADAPRGDVPFQIWSRSSLKRELQFLLSHTVHHYALMALTLQQHGFVTAREFGVAPSTLAYWGATT